MAKSGFKANTGITIGIVALILLVVFVFLALHFLDLKKRIYNIYSDTITYEEGFLTKNFSFIPIENLADSTVTQTLVDKIFNLYDVKISCQGAGQEIRFKNMINGPRLEKNIDSLISKSKSLVGTGKKEIKEARVEKIEKKVYKKALHRETHFTAEYRMNGTRTIVPILMLLPICLILFPFLFMWVIMLVAMLIKVSATRYLVKKNSIEERYDFISSKHKEFTNEKIMSVIFKENFIDKWFNTCSIHFWSIGSAEEIKFTNIKKSDELYKKILAKSGIRNQEILYKANSNFRVLDMFRANLLITIISFLIVLASVLGMLLSPFLILAAVFIFILYAVVIVYLGVYYKRSKLVFFKDYVYFKKGIFFRSFYYSLYNNIKDITITKYPFSKRGSLRFNIAGERIVQQQKRQGVQIYGSRGSQTVSNSFKINYIDDIDTKDELIDMIFCKRPDAKRVSEIEKNIEKYMPKPIISAKPAIANSLFGLIIVSVIVFPLLLVLPITAGLLVWSIKVRSYAIQPYRVLAKSGILYKKQTSIVFNKIDHINFNQGMLNKMFKNGNITVNTAGSSKAELVIKNIPNFKEFYEVLKKCY